jgi:hypothetical protein
VTRHTRPSPFTRWSAVCTPAHITRRTYIPTETMPGLEMLICTTLSSFSGLYLGRKGWVRGSQADIQFKSAQNVHGSRGAETQHHHPGGRVVGLHMPVSAAVRSRSSPVHALFPSLTSSREICRLRRENEAERRFSQPSARVARPPPSPAQIARSSSAYWRTSHFRFPFVCLPEK